MSIRYVLPVFLLTLPGLAQAQNLTAELEDVLNYDLVVQSLDAPVGADFLPDGSMLIVEQPTGRVKRFDGTDATTIGQFAVQGGGERGLLGIAVDPMFESSRRIYFYLSRAGAQQVGYATLDNNTLDVDGFTVLIDGLAASRNHNGGAIMFGPDGHLYLGVGDTGCNCGCGPADDDDIPPTGTADPSRNYFGTCLTNLHGKILRIDRDGNIPDTNPLVGVNEVAACTGGTGCGAARTFPSTTAAPRTEIYNWGFRNPWRITFDEQTGFLWIGDVGERTFEEITISTGPGLHHGWPLREGAEGVEVARCNFVTAQSTECTEPAFAYPRNEPPNTTGASVTGGVFSNHDVWPPEWRGRYWFADYVKGRVWTLTPNAARDGVEGERTIVVENARGPVHMMRGPEGGIYHIDVNVGTIWRLLPANANPTPDAGSPPDALPPDTGVIDTGIVPADAGTSPADAGPVADAGTPSDPDDDDDGCSCRTTAAPSPWWAGLAGLAFLAWRRYRR